jgi:glutathione S-transferase
MLTLYVKSGCPFCAKVLDTGEELGLHFTLKNVAEEGVTEELIARGGKKQTPYLVDDETGTEMYESDDITEYLHATYPKKV